MFLQEILPLTVEKIFVTYNLSANPSGQKRVSGHGQQILWLSVDETSIKYEILLQSFLDMGRSAWLEHAKLSHIIPWRWKQLNAFVHVLWWHWRRWAKDLNLSNKASVRFSKLCLPLLSVVRMAGRVEAYRMPMVYSFFFTKLNACHSFWTTQKSG